MLDLQPALEGVVPIDFGQVFGDLVSAAKALAHQPVIGADLPQVTNKHFRKPAVAFNLRNPWNSILRRDITRVVAEGLETVDVLSIETDARFVDEGGREDVGVAERGSLGANFFVALVEAPAVGERVKRTRL